MRARTRESRKRKRRIQRESKSQQMFRSQLFETLEDRRLLTTVGMTTLEQLQQQELERAFERVADLEQYPSYVLAEADSWVVQVSPGTDLNALKQSLNVDSLRPSSLLPNAYIFTLPEAVLPSAPMTSSTDDSSSPDDSSEDTTSDDVPTDELADTTIDPSDVIDDGVHSPAIEADSTVESATEDSLVIDGVEYSLPVDPVSVLSATSGVQGFYPLVSNDVKFQAGEWFRPNDEFFPAQWHLYNDGANSLGGTPGEDIHVDQVWNEPFSLSGEGITVGVVDSGIQMDHPDLVRNLEPSLACHFPSVAGNSGTILCDMTVTNGMADDLDGHGTQVAGIIAAEANNDETGVAGIAFNAKLANLSIDDPNGPNDEIVSEAFTRFADSIDIYNNSWGYPEWLSQVEPLTLSALQATTSGPNAGRGGLGSIYVFAAGNNHTFDLEPPTDGTPDFRTDFDGLASSRYTINVGGVGHTGVRASYSDIGSSLFVTAHTGDTAEDGGDYGIATTGIGGTYPTDFNGTSAAAPVVSGILALVLEANPSLTWRDVQHVVVNSARQTDVLNPSWNTNGAGHMFSVEYGFGVIDALASVVTAQNWQNVGPEMAISVAAEIEEPIAIPDNGTPPAGSSNQLGFVSSTVNVGQCLNTESVELVLTAPHEDWTDLSIKLISPSGTEAVFAEKHDADNPDTVGASYQNWVVSTPMFWDECSAGNWTLVIEDEELHNEGTLDAWQLNIYGTEEVIPPEPPPEASQGDISGTKWQDDNGDGMMNNDEPYVEGVWIYADIDNDGRIDIGEPAAVTDEFGRYALNGLATGVYTIREVMSPGWHQVYPGGDGSHQVTLTSAGPVTGVDFGNQYGFDFGDAPAPYPTLLANDGPSHGLINGFHMGASVDSELDGIPQSLALGDDANTNGDDEDGIFFTDIFADTTASLNVVISNGDQSAGVLQGWVDFNADGDWNDAGEQIFTDQAVLEGVNTLNFSVPDGAQPGYTFARFRYGYERGIGPTGPAYAGEVEDHRVLVMENNPVAIDDSYVVDQNDSDFTMDVLDNDLTGIVGGLEILDGLSNPSHGGTVSVEFDAVLGRDVINYTPAVGFFSPPVETFTYTLEDDAGVRDTATVFVTVQPEFVDPLAIDDTFNNVLGSNTTPQAYNVVANDIEGTNGELNIVAVTQPTHGTVTFDPLEGKHIFYEPDGVFFNMESFTYTVENPLGQRQIANVTVHVEPEEDDNVVDFGVSFRDTNGVALPTNEVSVGDRFEVLVTVEDLHTPNPEGVFSAYMDLLYDRDHVSVVSASAVTCDNAISGMDFGICFDGEYTSLIHGSADKPGLIDDVGALRPIVTTPGDVGAMELYVVTFQANVEGTSLFETDPADDPVFETTVYGQGAVAAPEIEYGWGQIVISPSGEPEGEALDTNGDGVVTPMDVLNVINDLNQYGSRAVAGGAEGETAAAESRLDVNRDQYISPADALMLINHLNKSAGTSQANEAAQGEGEAAPAPVMGPLPVMEATADDNQVADGGDLETDLFADAVLPTADPARNQQTLSEADATLASQDRIFADLQADADGEVDGLLDDLAADVCQAWLT